MHSTTSRPQPPPPEPPSKRAEPGWPELLWRIFVVFLIVAVPLVIVESLWTAWEVPVPDLYTLGNDPAQIYYVISGGYAEAAGVRAGDRIIQFNGLAFTANSLAQVNKHADVGSIAQITLQHPNGQVVTVEVPLVSVASVTLDALRGHVLLALLLWGGGLVLLRLRFDQPEVRLLFLLAQALALGLLFPSMPFIIWYHAHLTWANIAGASAFFSVALLLHFHSTFPVRLGDERQRCWFFGALYGLTLGAAGAWIAANYGRLPYNVSLLVAGYGALVLVSAVLVSLYVYFRRATPDGRRRLRLILISSSTAAFFAGILYLVPIITLGYPLVPDVVLAASLCSVPAAYIYATLRHNLFGIDHFLNRALVYAILGVVILILYAGPLVWLDHYVPYGWLPRALVMAGLTLLVALAFEWTRGRVQRLVDQLFYGGWYDYPKVVELVSATLVRALDWQELADVLTRQVPALMQLRGAQLQMGEQATPPLDPALQPQLPFPLGGEGHAKAVWVVGPRRDGDELSAADQRILKTLARQADVALSNVRLVQTLRRQLDEIRNSRKTLTRLEHQLLRMREEERRRLSRDLHDGPIGVLVGLNIQLGMLAGRPEVGDAATPLACALGGMRAEVRTLLADLRQVCANLRPPTLDTLGLGAALRALAAEWSVQHEIPVHLDLAPDALLQTLPGEVAVNLYRVAQEALANIARHASARQVSLSLQWADPLADLTLTLQDDGQGFVVAGSYRHAEHGHFGLAAMQERVALIGGHWRLESTPGRGTAVFVVWHPTVKTQADIPKTTL